MKNVRKKIGTDLPADEREYFNCSKNLLCAEMTNLADEKASELTLRVSCEPGNARLPKE